MTSQFPDLTSLSIVFLVKFSYRSKVHVNVITGSGFMTIFVCKGLTKNPEIGNTFVWVLSNIWRKERVRDTKFGKNVSNEKLLDAAKCQVYYFYRFWVIKEKTTSRVFRATHALMSGLELSKVISFLPKNLFRLDNT